MSDAVALYPWVIIVTDGFVVISTPFQAQAVFAVSVNNNKKIARHHAVVGFVLQSVVLRSGREVMSDVLQGCMIFLQFRQAMHPAQKAARALAAQAIRIPSTITRSIFFSLGFPVFRRTIAQTTFLQRLPLSQFNAKSRPHLCGANGFLKFDFVESQHQHSPWSQQQQCLHGVSHVAFECSFLLWKVLRNLFYILVWQDCVYSLPGGVPQNPAGLTPPAAQPNLVGGGCQCQCESLITFAQ